MDKMLEVKPVGVLSDGQGKMRMGERSSLASCMTSLAEALGEGVGWCVSADGMRTRTLYNGLVAAGGMAFGLLWSWEHCLSALDLTQVYEEHNDTIAYAFDYLGYGYEIVQRADAKEAHARLQRVIVESIDEGRPVLAFGVVGPPECSLICGYCDGGETLVGWSQFLPRAHTSRCANGMFRVSRADGWSDRLWKIVLCRTKTFPERSWLPIIRRGIRVMQVSEVNGYRAGTGVYDAWIEYVSGMEGCVMGDIHGALAWNHGEMRGSLGDFFMGTGESCLSEVASYFFSIRVACEKVLEIGMEVGGCGSAKRVAIVALIQEMKALDRAALEGLKCLLP